MEHLTESLADVSALVSRISWIVMDEEQRDEIMTKVVVPRWGATTSDGVVLKATKWAEILGATVDAIDGRYRRLRRLKAQSKAAISLPEAFKGAIRGARSAIRNHPELAAELLKDPEIRATIQEAIIDSMPPSNLERPVPIRTLNDQWHAWLNGANTLFTNGARLASATDNNETVDLDAHAAAARVLYDRLVERQIDAEIRSFMDAEVG